MEKLQDRIDNLTAREVNGVYKPLMEPGGNIEKDINGYVNENGNPFFGIKHALERVLDFGDIEAYAARRKINKLRLKYNAERNNDYVSNGIAKGVAARAEAILDAIIAFKTEERNKRRGGKTRKVRKTRKTRKGLK